MAKYMMYKEDFVSIPYGSIKSPWSCGLSTPGLWVSIPYGSIKSSHEFIMRFAPFLFQFLMVRLKGVCPSEGRSAFCVSIPYGSIKRPCRISPHPAPTPFQFLMVRLKVPLFMLICFTTTKVSIPYGSIKSWSGFVNLVKSGGFNSLWFD